jgi:hypothetical protein
MEDEIKNGLTSRRTRSLMLPVNSASGVQEREYENKRGSFCN